MLSRFAISNSVFGTSLDLVCGEDGVSWIDRDSHSELVWTGNVDERSSNSLDAAFSLNGQTVTWNFPDPFRLVVNQLLPKDYSGTIPWSSVAPTRVVTGAIKKLVTQLSSAAKSSSIVPYEIFKSQHSVFESMVRPRIDLQKLKRAIEEATDEGSRGALKSMTPGPDGFCETVRYNRLPETGSAKTGRLTVKSGPYLLTMKREYRKIIKSRYDGGSIWYLDYSSLEPRGFAAFRGVALPADFYKDFAIRILKDPARDKSAKAAIIRLFYGSGIDAAAADGGLTRNEARSIQSALEDLLGVSEFSKQLGARARDTGRIQNAFGRTVVVEKDTPSHVCFNNWAQSTGHDVALLGFSKIARSIGKSGLDISILGTIHDAIILDVHPACQKYIPILTDLGSRVNEISKIAKFPLKSERVS